MDEDLATVRLADATRRAMISLKRTSVFFLSAIKNTAVQPMLDGVYAYLPTPAEFKVIANDTSLPVSAPSLELTPTSDAQGGTSKPTDVDAGVPRDYGEEHIHLPCADRRDCQGSSACPHTR